MPDPAVWHHLDLSQLRVCNVFGVATKFSYQHPYSFTHRSCKSLLSVALQDAYSALQANPTAESALSSLNRLVKKLISTSNLVTLCQLPYASFYTVSRPDGR